MLPLHHRSSGLVEIIDTLYTNITEICNYRQALLANELISGIYEVSTEEDSGEPCAVLVVIPPEFFKSWRQIPHAPEKS